MFIHRPIALAIIDSLQQVFGENWLVDRQVEKAFRENKKWGSTDRQGFAQAIYDITRMLRKYQFLIRNDRSPAELRKEEFANILNAYLILNGHETNLKFENALDLTELKMRWSIKKPDAIDLSIPDWLHDFGKEELGEQEWLDQMRILNLEAPVFLRTNTLKVSRDALIHELVLEDVSPELVEGSEVAVKISRSNVFSSKPFQAGHFEVQDLHSQKVVEALDPQPGERVVDACAGGGGKTLYAAARMQNKGQLFAMDINAKKLEQLRLRSRRAGVFNTEIRMLESTKDIKRLAETADRLLLDVPCSGSGVFRRNPDARWRLSPERLKNLQDTQLKIISDYHRVLKPGGTLVYSTCSIFPSENQKIIQKFLSQNETSFTKVREMVLPVRENGGDGFYICTLTKAVSV